jgi:membrane protease YdiL (CAAX protease family)
MALWLVALVVSLLVPALHQGDRSWWPWTCVAGIGGGALALLYVRRGRGNAAGADLSARSPRSSDGPTSST